MKRWFSSIFTVALRELRRALKDSGVIVFFFVVPLLYPLLYAYLYNQEVVREVPVVAVDECRSSLSREFLRKSDATPDLKIISYCSDMEEARELIRTHKAYGLIHIPGEFSERIADGLQATVNLYSDMSGLLYYKAILSGCTHVSLSMNRDIKMARLSGMSDVEKESMVQPIDYEYVPMFNPQNGFCSFIIPAVLVVVIQQTLVLGICLLVGTETERRRKGETFLGIDNEDPMAVLLGKGLCYFLIYSFICIYTLCIVPMLFHLPQLWQADDMLLFAVPLLLSCIFFALTLSYFVRDRESCFLLFVFVSVPLLFISGISWPASNIPAFWKHLSHLFPSTFGINGFIRLSSMGATLSDIRREYLCLWIQAGAYFLLSLLIFIRKNRSDDMPGIGYIRDREVELRERLRSRWRV